MLAQILFGGRPVFQHVVRQIRVVAAAGLPGGIGRVVSGISPFAVFQFEFLFRRRVRAGNGIGGADIRFTGAGVGCAQRVFLLEQRIGLQSFLDFSLKLQSGKLQYTYGLLELWSKRQPLTQFDIECLFHAAIVAKMG